MKNKRIIAFLGSLILSSTFLQNIVSAQTWYVCLGSFKSKLNAENFSRLLTENELPSQVIESPTDNGLFYRVIYSTPSSDINEARILRDKIPTFRNADRFSLKNLWVCTGPDIKPVELPAAAVNSAAPQIQDIKKEPAPIILETNKTADIPLSDETPYSALLNIYKEEQPAIHDRDRLLKDSIPAYIIKTWDEDEYISFNLHAGAFKSMEETETFLDDLIEYGIESAELSDWNEIKDSAEAYNSLITTTEVSFTEGNIEIPDSFNKDITRIITEFPVNPDFQLESLIIGDINAARENDHINNELSDLLNEFSNPDLYTAYSISTYRDELFDRNINIVIITGEENCFTDELEIAQAEFQNKDLKLNVKGEVFDGYWNPGESLNILFAFSPKLDMLIIFASNDDESKFQQLMAESFNNSSLLNFPQIRKNLLTLPQNRSDVERQFLEFKLKKVTEEYAKEKSYAEWAIPIVGHWCAETSFIENDRLLESSFFDLDYDLNAKNIHKIFTDMHRNDPITDNNHPSSVENVNSWFIGATLFNTSNEVSFSTKSYIIAINSYLPDLVSEEDLVRFASDLQIWK